VLRMRSHTQVGGEPEFAARTGLFMRAGTQSLRVHATRTDVAATPLAPQSPVQSINLLPMLLRHA
jgi:hypothetical protein